MIKKQIGWQTEKFTFSADMAKNQIYRQLRAEVQGMQQNGWEVISQNAAGYDPTNGDITMVIGLVKFEWVPEPVETPVAEKKSVGRPAKEDK